MSDRRFSFNDIDASSFVPSTSIDLAEEARAGMAALEEVKREEREAEREKFEAVLGIKEDTSELNRKLADANARIDLLNTQVDNITKQMETGDAANAKSSRIATILSIIGIAIAFASLLVALFK